MSAKKTTPTKSVQFGRQLAGLSFMATVTAFWQLADAIHLFKYPDNPLNCNLNPILDCGSVINNSYSSIFGPPNMLIGIVFFSFMLAVGVMLSLGVRANRALALTQLTLASGMTAFSAWFFYVSLYSMGKVCIFCVGIWAALIPIFVLSLRFVFQRKEAPRIPKSFQQFVIGNTPNIIMATYVIMVMLYLVRFREYYFG